MTEEQKDQAKNLWISLAPYIGAVILDIALCGLLVISGRELTVEAIVAVTGCVGALLFFKKMGGGSGPTIAAGGMLVLVSALLMGCGAACTTERQIVDALDVGITAADEVVGQRGGEEYETASWITRGAVAIGRAAVGACETLRDGSGWTLWLLQAVEAAYSVVEIIDGANADIEEDTPIELLRAIGRIEYELSR
jgi:hypothetical protein